MNIIKLPYLIISKFQCCIETKLPAHVATRKSNFEFQMGHRDARKINAKSERVPRTGAILICNPLSREGPERGKHNNSSIIYTQL